MNGQRSLVFTLVAAIAACAAGCAQEFARSPSPTGSSTSTMSEPSRLNAVTANKEQLQLISAMQRVALGAWADSKVERFRTCETADGEPGIQLTRSVRGSGVDDPTAAAQAVRAELLARGFDAEVRRTTEVVATGSELRYAAFNSVDGISIIQVYSFCYPFDIVHDDPTVPSSELPAS